MKQVETPRTDALREQEAEVWSAVAPHSLSALQAGMHAAAKKLAYQLCENLERELADAKAALDVANVPRGKK